MDGRPPPPPAAAAAKAQAATAAGVGLSSSSFHLARASLSPARFGAELFVSNLLQRCFWAPRLREFYATQAPGLIAKSEAEVQHILREAPSQDQGGQGLTIWCGR